MKYYLIFFIAVLMLVSCHKDDTPTFYVPKELKDLYLFRPGSYWTMRDSLTGRVDSFFVTRIDSSISRYNTGYYEDNYINIKEVNIDGSNTPDSAYYGFHLYSEQVSFSYSDFINKEMLNSEIFDYMSIVHDEIVVNGTNYRKVKEINDLERISINYGNLESTQYLSDYFINNPQGFIKIRMNTKFHHFVWEFRSAHIIR